MGRGPQLAQDFIQSAESWDPATWGQPKPGCFLPAAPSPPRGPAFPSLMPRPHLHGQKEGGENEDSLATGAPTLGFHLGLKTL